MNARQTVRTMVATVMGVLALATPVCSAAAAVSEIVVDARSGSTLFASRAGAVRPPASLAKLMTLLLTFDAIRSGTLRLGDRVTMTSLGARQPPSRLGLAAGRSIDVRSAMRAVAVVSANDVAMALAQRIAGSESGFVRAMNRRAGQIGMTATRFSNPTGLGPAGGLTSARDMAMLANYVVRHYPAQYGLFATRSIRWAGQRRANHNHLLGRVPGVDGLKTGYTVPAGYNLAASAMRGGRRIVVVVLGARTAAARDLLVSNLLEAGFSSPHAVRARSGRQDTQRRKRGSIVRTTLIEPEGESRSRRAGDARRDRGRRAAVAK